MKKRTPRRLYLLLGLISAPTSVHDLLDLPAWQSNSKPIAVIATASYRVNLIVEARMNCFRACPISHAYRSTIHVHPLRLKSLPIMVYGGLMPYM